MDIPHFLLVSASFRFISVMFMAQTQVNPYRVEIFLSQR